MLAKMITHRVLNKKLKKIDEKEVNKENYNVKDAYIERHALKEK